MRQIAQSYRTGKLSLVDVADPRAPSTGILVDTRASLISAGTERMLVDLARKNLLAKAKQRPDLVVKVVDKVKREGVLAAFEAVRSKLDSPIPLGYSMAGRVLDVGRNASGFAIGDRVACAGAGFANHAELNCVPVNLAVPVPDRLSDEEACFVTVGAIALHGVRLVRPQLGDVVAVIGLGLIGQIAVSLLAAHGCKVLGIDVDPSKVKLALSRGASMGCVSGVDDCVEVTRAISRGHGADSVVITASAQTNDPLVVAGDIARDRARVSVVGLVPMEIPRSTYYAKELEVIVSRSYGPGRYDADYEERGRDYPIGYVRWTERRNLEAVLYAIETGKLDVKSLITHRFKFDDAMDAYALISGERPEPHLGVVLHYGDGRPAHPNGATSSTPSAPPVRSRPTGRVGVALLGTGAFATSVLLPQLSELSNASLVATVSGRGLSAKHAAERFDARAVLSDLDAVLDRSDVHAVMIATRHDAHAMQAIKALQAGRDVFVEKPAAISLEQLEELKGAVMGSGMRFLVGFNRRFSPYARATRDQFLGRSSGLVMHARINAGKIASGSWVTDSTEGGGRIVGECCHFIDLMSFWAGAPPILVSAHAIGQKGGYQREDNLVMSVSFADGSVGTLTYTAMGDASIGKERYEVFCEGCVVVIEDFRTMTVTSRGKAKTQRALRADKGHREELRQFFEACLAGSESPIPWSSIEATTKATFALEHAWKTGSTVEL